MDGEHSTFEGRNRTYKIDGNKKDDRHNEGDDKLNQRLIITHDRLGEGGRKTPRILRFEINDGDWSAVNPLLSFKDLAVTTRGVSIKDQLDVTCYFISLLTCSTCFGY